MKTKRPFLSTIFFTMLGRVGGILIPFLIAFLFGATPATDAFLFAYTVIFSLLNIFSHLFESAMVSYLVGIKGDPKEVAARSNAIFLIALPVVLGFCLFLGFSFHYFFSGPEGASKAALTRDFFFQMLPGMGFALAASQNSGLFFIYHIFSFPVVSPIVRSLVMAIVLLSGHARWGARILSGAFVLGEFVRWLIGWMALKAWTPCRAFSVKWDGAWMRRFFAQAGFQTLALTAIYFMPVADQFFLASLKEGSLSIFNYADRFLQIPYLLFWNGLFQIFLTDWSESYHHGDFQAFREKIRKDIKITGLMAFLIMAAFVLCSWPLTYLGFARTKLGPAQLRLFQEVFILLSVCFFPGAVRLLYGRFFVTIGASRFYAFQSLAELLLKLVLNVFLVGRYGAPGIALASVCVCIFTSLWSSFYAHRWFAKNALLRRS